MVEISIVIPVFNNQDSIEILVKDIRQCLCNKISFEVILIDDGSSDNSWDKIKNIINNPGINVLGIKHKTNFGQENAKLAGLRNAKGNFIVFMDADYQHDPKDIFQLYEKCKQGTDVCYANFTNKDNTLFKNMGSVIYNKLATAFLNKPKGIYLSSFNMINKKTASLVSAYSTPLLNIDSIIFLHTQNVSQINTALLKSLNQHKNYTYKKLIQLFFILLPGYSVKPLRFAFFAGAIVASGGLLLVFLKIISALTPITFIGANFFNPFQVVAITLIGLLLFSIGILGEYIGKIYLILHGAKQYEIETIISSKPDHE